MLASEREGKRVGWQPGGRLLASRSAAAPTSPHLVPLSPLRQRNFWGQQGSRSCYPHSTHSTRRASFRAHSLAATNLQRRAQTLLHQLVLLPPKSIAAARLAAAKRLLWRQARRQLSSSSRPPAALPRLKSASPVCQMQQRQDCRWLARLRGGPTVERVFHITLERKCMSGS